jgi:hypothetical protein
MIAQEHGRLVLNGIWQTPVCLCIGRWNVQNYAQQGGEKSIVILTDDRTARRFRLPLAMWFGVKRAGRPVVRFGKSGEVLMPRGPYRRRWPQFKVQRVAARRPSKLSPTRNK